MSAKLARLVVGEGDHRHERNLLNASMAWIGVQFEWNGITPEDHEHVQIVVHSMRLWVEHGLPIQIRTRVTMRRYSRRSMDGGHCHGTG